MPNRPAGDDRAALLPHLSQAGGVHVAIHPFGPHASQEVDAARGPRATSSDGSDGAPCHGRTRCCRGPARALRVAHPHHIHNACRSGATGAPPLPPNRGGSVRTSRYPATRFCPILLLLIALTSGFAAAADVGTSWQNSPPAFDAQPLSGGKDDREASDGEECDGDLHGIAWNVLFVAMGVHSPPAQAVGESAHAMVPADPVRHCT